jgi:2-polyprenyl-6-methoxyphenol hydroxylase-like FAD-dependent oxidoreductase
MRALVVGGGIGGLCTARALSQAGYEPLVFEKATALEHVQVGGAIHVWHNGMRGLQKLGFGEQLERATGPAAKVAVAEMRNWRGRLITSWSPAQTERELGAATVGVLRPDLHRILEGNTEAGIVRLGKKCVGFSEDGSSVTARFADGSEEKGDVLIGADGLRSAIRAALKGDEPPRYAGYASCQAVAPYPVDDTVPIGLFRVVWGRGARFLFYRLGAEHVYWEGIFATEAGRTDPPGGKKRGVLDRFAGWDSPVEAILAATAEEAIFRADIYDRPTLKTWGRGRVTLLGDAAHAMTNAVGQGANQTIEDAVVLGKLLAGKADVPSALRAYETSRIGRTTEVHKLASTLSSMSLWDNPLVCAVRDRMLTVMFAMVGKRAMRKDMGYEF